VNQSPSGSGFSLAWRTAVDIFPKMEEFLMNRSTPAVIAATKPDYPHWLVLLSLALFEDAWRSPAPFVIMAKR
jgi:hypothetical protein